ncbi:MAG TPA: hypothetical protein VGX68_26300 [Thermoanaerobaculia bacterium]|nr:hypothetical protein [Thermoanaerobaculia bacterium]
MRTLRKQLPFCLVGLALLGFAGISSAQRPETFSGSLVVREREIVVDPPARIAASRLTPRDFRVFVDGQPREVTRVEPSAGRWTIVLYFDQVLARPGTTFYSGLALANRARELARLGSVEIATAGPDPHVVLKPTREARRIKLALMDLSSAARIERNRSEGARKGTEPSTSQTGRQLDKLLAFLTARHPPGPRTVFLVADGPNLSPEQMALIEDREILGSKGTPAFVFHHAAQLLAASGWVTIPVPLRREELGTEAAQSDIDIFRQGAAPSDHQNGVPPILPGRPPKKTTLSVPGAIDTFVDPKGAALRALARPTAGTVIVFESQLDEVLGALPRRWRLWFTEPDVAADGQLHRIAVTLPRLKKEARVPEWLPSP